MRCALAVLPENPVPQGHGLMDLGIIYVHVAVADMIANVGEVGPSRHVQQKIAQIHIKTGG
jgi:hypothetical protein